MEKIKKGNFFVLDGGEGTGKGTYMDKLQEKFGDTCIYTREPGGIGSEMAEKIRYLMLDDPLSKSCDAKTMFGLIWGSRAAHMKDIVIPALLAGKNVISDRGDSSTYAYQICGPEAHDLKDIFGNIRKLYLGDFAPDLYIILDQDPKIGLERKSKQKDFTSNHFDEKDLPFHNRVRQGYLDFAKFSDIESIVLDANRLIEDVFKDIYGIITNFR